MGRFALDSLLLGAARCDLGRRTDPLLTREPAEEDTLPIDMGMGDGGRGALEELDVCRRREGRLLSVLMCAFLVLCEGRLLRVCICTFPLEIALPAELVLLARLGGRW